MNDYCYRFPISDDSDFRSRDPNQMIETHLKELLDLLVPTVDHKEVIPDGFKLLNSRQTVHSLYPATNGSGAKASTPIDIYEPRIGFITRILESLSGLIEFETDGKPVKVTGFRLKHMDRWISAGGGASDLLAHAATRCNLDCMFCYNKSAPPALKPDSTNSEKEIDEILSRIGHYIPNGKLNVFPNIKSPGEMLAHPKIEQILTALRTKTDECFRISTNGSALTPTTIQMLSAVKPVYLDISINSASPDRRRLLMKDLHPEIALNALNLLEDQQIPYSLVIVPWPVPDKKTLLEDLIQTIRFADTHRPTLIQISLPGQSGRHPDTDLVLDEHLWVAIKNEITRIRKQTECPIVMRPGLFEEYLNPEENDKPHLVGVIRNSPLAIAGICGNDQIIKINGIPVKSVNQARSLLTILHGSDLTQSSVTVLRNDEKIDTSVDFKNFKYPYQPVTATHLGAVFRTSGIPESWGELLWQTIENRCANSVLVMTSKLVRPSLEALLNRNGRFSGIDLHLWVPKNRYLGGNIFMGDLLVVEDFISAATEFMEEKKIHPDLIILPATPFRMSGWGRDLTGRVYLDIERHLSIPVALIECDPIFD